MKLLKASNQQILIPSVERAESLWSRIRGLLGRNGLSKEQALWIDECNSIHTCFMRFPIDAIFVDNTGRVESVHSVIPPWRFVWASRNSKAVFELCAGRATELNIKVGDHLHVVH